MACRKVALRCQDQYSLLFSPALQAVGGFDRESYRRSNKKKAQGGP